MGRQFDVAALPADADSLGDAGRRDVRIRTVGPHDLREIADMLLDDRARAPRAMPFMQDSLNDACDQRLDAVAVAICRQPADDVEAASSDRCIARVVDIGAQNESPVPMNSTIATSIAIRPSPVDQLECTSRRGLSMRPVAAPSAVQSAIAQNIRRWFSISYRAS